MGRKRLAQSGGRLLRHDARAHSGNRGGSAGLQASRYMKARNPGSTRASRVGFGAPAETSTNVLYAKRRLPHFERTWGKYAVTFSTRNHRQLSPSERDIVLQSIVHGAEHNQHELYVACVMPDHVHFLFEPQVK